MPNPQHVHYFRLDILTPVHIGSGELLDPSQYLLKKIGEKSQLTYFRIDPNRLFESATNKSAFAELFDQEDWKQTLKNIQQAIPYGPHSCKLFSIPCSEADAKHSHGIKNGKSVKEYYDAYRNLSSPGNNYVSEALHSGLAHDFLVPGSSLKGALRTVIKASLPHCSPADFKILMHGLSVSDCVFPVEAGQIFVTELFKQKREKEFTPANLCEALAGEICSGVDTCSSYGRICLEEKGKTGAWNPRIEKGKERLDIPTLFEKCREFSLVRYKHERDTFYTKDKAYAVGDSLKRIDPLLDKLGEKDALLRIGQHSHKESFEPQTPPSEWGTSRGLANKRYPFGWVRLQLCEKDEYSTWVEQQNAREKHARQADAERRDRLEVETQKREQKEAERLAEEEKERQHQEMLAQLPDEERELRELEELQFEESSIENKVWLRIKNDGYASEEDTRRAAQILWDYWKRVEDGGGHRKTSGKVSSKQKPKLLELKKILGKN